MNNTPFYRNFCSLLLLGLLLIFSSEVFAMEHNLAMPYATKPSPPNIAELAFYCPNSETLLFTGKKDIEIVCRAALRSVSLSYGVMRNMFTTPFIKGQAEARPGNIYVMRIPVAKLYPGFYDIRVVLDPGDGKLVNGQCTFGYKVDKLPYVNTRPADFEAFWAKGKAELAKIALDPQVGPFQQFKGKEIDAYNLAHACLPGDYDPRGHRTEEVECAKVDFAGIGNKRIHGWLAKPKGNGPFPAMLVLPGAGFAARPMPLEHARHGYVAMDIQVHGQEVDLEKYPTLPGYYQDFVYKPIEGYYYYQVYLNAVQAVHYLLSRPDVDPTRIVVVGGSQGGRLSVSTAALEPRVAASIPAIAHFSNIPYLDWSKQCNTAKKDGMDRADTPAPPDTDEQRCLAYYDTMNFAQDIKCPVLMNAGLVDGASYPMGVFAVFNRLGSKDKQIVPVPNCAHDWFAEFDRRAWRWLDEKLHLPAITKP
ncbi:MAG TPA: acetylxylan esterase [Armatimonadota bacterium]